MEFRRLAAMVLVALVLPFSFTSCLLLEEALLTPSEAETTMAVKDSASMGPKVDWLLTAEGLDASVGQRVTLKFLPMAKFQVCGVLESTPMIQALAPLPFIWVCLHLRREAR